MQRSGNLDLMRLIAAFCVLWYHQHALTKTPEAALPFFGTGELGVYVFFAISGYLNAKSILRSRSIIQFLWARLLRIYPALVFCVAFCILVGAIATSLPLREFIGSADPLTRNEPLSFLLRNSTLFFGLDYRLPGVFANNPHPDVVNGSLWTLPYEVKYYLGLAAIALCCAFRPGILALVGIALFASLAAYGLFADLTPTWSGKYGTKLLIIFAAGVMMGAVETSAGRFSALVISTTIAGIVGIQGNAATAVLLAIAPMCLALSGIPLPAWAGPKIDISYGVYLYAFPIQQLAVTTDLNWWAQLFLTATVTTVLALLSAILIERPALARLREKPVTRPTLPQSTY